MIIECPVVKNRRENSHLRGQSWKERYKKKAYALAKEIKNSGQIIFCQPLVKVAMNKCSCSQK